MSDDPRSRQPRPREGGAPGQDHQDHQGFVTIAIGGQWFGIPVLTVQDVLGPQRITVIPTAPSEIAGALNLRGRIVTAIDVRRRLRLPDRKADEGSMSIVVEHGGELYSLIVDAVGEVLSLPVATLESNPSTLDPVWNEISRGVLPLQGRLLLVLDVARLLSVDADRAA